MVGDDFRYGDYWLSEYGFRVYDPDSNQEFVEKEIEVNNSRIEEN